MKNIGIVLSGGGARCFAHLGLLEALKDNEIYPDVFAGTSGGAMIGALWVKGYDTETILDYLYTSFIRDYASIFKNAKEPQDSMVFYDSYKKYFPKNQFSELEKDLFVGVTNLTDSTFEIISSGPLVKTLLAAATFPPLMAPLEMNGKLYMDGAIMNNFPVEPVRAISKIVLGSHVMPMSGLANAEVLSKNSSYMASRTAQLSVYSKSKSNFAACDYLFEPPFLSKVGFFDFQKSNEIYKRSYDYATHNMPEIRLVCKT